MIRATLISAFLLFFCYLVLPQHVNGSDDEVDHLRELTKSQMSLGSFRNSAWNLLSSKKASLSVVPQDGSMEADKIVALSGQPEGVNFDQYAGYVTVDPTAGRAVFYYFVESPQESDTKPLVLWLNGGPGCSSLGGGAMVELGPFRANSDGKTLYANQFAWNKVANVIFLESPAGVGFSYSNTTSDYKLSGDKRTVDDTHTFLVNWLESFPQYKTRDFFITGESYAGHYIPELASAILTNNKITSNTIINLKGIAIGNAYLDDIVNTKATYDYYWTHALISDETHESIRSSCAFTSRNVSINCVAALRSADAEIGHIDHYDIYAPLCRGAPSKLNEFARPLKEVDPCSGSYANSYLNLPEVQTALHANVTGLPYPWSACSGFVGGRNWSDRPATMLPTVKELIASGISVWLYSGDQDAVCPVTSTRYFISMLNLPLESSWRPRYIDNEVGGYVVAYKGLIFATVRGAGHMVPSYQPQRALAMISAFLKGQLPTSS